MRFLFSPLLTFVLHPDSTFPMHIYTSSPRPHMYASPYVLPPPEITLTNHVASPLTAHLTPACLSLPPQVRGSPRWPAVNAWYDAMDSRPSYHAIKSDDFTITHTLEPQIGPVVLRKEGAAHRDVIEGRRGAWDLPLQPEVTAWGTDDGTGSGGAKEEAAASLVSNHEAIVRFALRSSSPASHTRWGLKGATSSEAVDALTPLVSAAFRHVAHALLQGVEAVGAPPEELRKPEVAAAVAYLRDKVGVPRDLTYPAARQLRAHLQWFLRGIGSDL